MRAGVVVLAVTAAVAVGAIGWRVMREEAAPPAVASPTPRPLDDTAAALAALQRRAAAAPGDPAAQRELGRALFALERYPEAATVYAKVTALAPRDAGAWASLGEARTLAAEKVTKEAHDAFARTLALEPRNPRARYFLAVEKEAGGDHRGAIRDWSALLADGPPDAPWAGPVRELIGQVAAREGIAVSLPPTRPGPSREQVAAAAELTPAQQDAMARGMVDRLASRLAANPRDPDGWAMLLRTRLVLDDRAGAVAALGQARRALADDRAGLAKVEGAAQALGLR